MSKQTLTFGCAACSIAGKASAAVSSAIRVWPAVVLSEPAFQQHSGHLLLAMVTSARQSAWPLDWPIANLTAAGLGQPCLVRVKLFTLDERLVLGTVGFGSPVFGVFAEDNNPRFRDGKPWPEGIVDGVRLGEEAGYMPVNARTVWDAGAVLGYCTDTTYDPLAGLDHELKILNVMFSPKDLVKMMGPNTASYVQMGDQIGTLEVGKLADIVLLNGDPLEGYWNWLKTRLVVKGGVVVVDKL